MPIELRLKQCRMAACHALVVLSGVAAQPLMGQTAQQLEQLRQNPQLVQQYLRQSGMTADQVRNELRARGYPPSTLDPFLSDVLPGMRGQVTTQTWLGLQALGLDSLVADGLETIDQQVGLISNREALPPDSGVRLFGLDAFQRSTLFQPVLSGPVPPNYRLGPGDALVLILTGDVELVHELTVTREGFIIIPQVGQLIVNNLTMTQLETLLQQRLSRSYSGISRGSTRFDVTVGRLRTNQVFVTGAVRQPGAFQLSSVATVLNALYAAGGPTEIGNPRKVELRRQDEVVVTLDLYAYLLRGSTENDVMLQQGDIVFVPTRGRRVAVSGAVVRPAIYEMGDGETLRDVLRMAGGV